LGFIGKRGGTAEVFYFLFSFCSPRVLTINMNKIIQFQGRSVIKDHITSFWIEAGDTVCVTLSSGELLKEQFASETVKDVIANFTNLFSDTPHI